MAKDLHANIGHIAGLVWRCLERNGRPMSCFEISLSIGVWPWKVLLALGWLSREGKGRLWWHLVALMAELKKH